MSKKTVILGASTNTTRYAYLAAERLTSAGHEIVPVGIKTGDVFGKKILDLKDKPQIEDVHTVTLYVGTKNLAEWSDYILSLNPKRIIFNPGTEHTALQQAAQSRGIETVVGCTLVMLGASQF